MLNNMPGWKPLTGFCDPTATAAFVEGAGGKCDFGAFVFLIKSGMTDLVLISFLVAMVMFMYAGFLWLTSKGSASQHTRALDVLWKVVMGYVWMIAAWVIIHTIANALVKTEFNQFIQ